MSWAVPLFATDLGEEELEAVTRVIKSGWLTMGDETRMFEQEFAAYLGVKHAFMVSNCTAALHLAHHVFGICRGDEIISPALTFVATANSIVQTGATPIFADVVSTDDLTVSPEEIVAQLSEHTKGIAVMHYGGFACAMDEIMKIARERNLYVVEDCAHSAGGRFDGRMTGTIGDVGCFSFFSNKNLSTGEGGMLVTNRDDLAERFRVLRSHGMTTGTLDRHRGHAFSYDVVDCGFNYRSAELNAALGRVQLKKLEAKNKRRRLFMNRYFEQLGNIDGVSPAFDKRRDIEASACHIMAVVLNEGIDRAVIMQKMKDQGIQTSIHYRPIHTFSAYRAKGTVCGLDVTDSLTNRLLTLPLYPAMSENQVDIVVDALRDAMGAVS
ncbi:MAG TPA: DegT/DnrJ/EryC1/StrS family aminotransferase [Dissulfurispiraceae bacterium]|nr:DegT/DnrJ/EryC1/StrS family aminotransferase [Dissulfurispiraceae bacterium]